MVDPVSTYEQTVALIIISVGAPSSVGHANSYLLCRQLSRIFGLINCVEISRSLERNSYVNTTLSDGMLVYRVTALGSKFIIDNQVSTLVELSTQEYVQTDFRQEMIKHYWSKI